MSDYYVYIYLDPCKPGHYSYKDLPISFLYEPMYVGRGHNDRYLYHIRCINKKGYNGPFISRLGQITNNNYFPYILKLYINLTEKESSNKEILVIRSIGRVDMGSGVLFNKTRGGDGVVSCFFTKERREAISKKMRGDRNNASKINMPYSKILDKARRAAITTKRLGLLKGSNHPLYGKGHSDTSREKIRDNHANCSGKNNSHAKKWKVCSPKGEEYICCGNLESFCRSNSISHHTLKRNRGKGPIVNVIGTGLSKKTIGWSLYEL